jgi:hypothetical protein
MWKAAVVGEFEGLIHNFPGGTEENHKNPDQDSSVLAKIQGRHLPKTSQNHYHQVNFTSMLHYLHFRFLSVYVQNHFSQSNSTKEFHCFMFVC